jgi:regulator of replication initiation timing
MARPKDHPALVPKEIIDQTTVFTQPRGRLEMGGLLIGHIDHEGNNVVTCGFFPKQTEASPGYCEFDGGALAMAMDACDMANSRCGGPHTPNIQIIGWIHTHPDIGIFLSGIDINTFGHLRSNRQDGRFVAVVVDPLRKEHGVFNSEKSARNEDAQSANAVIKLSEDLEARYNKFLTRMRYFQNVKGKEELPFIMPGLLYSHRKALGDEDDVLEARFQTIDKLTRGHDDILSKTVPQIRKSFDSIRESFSHAHDQLDRKTSQLLSKVKEESTARAALQMKLSGKIDDSNRVLKSLVAAELKKESTARKELEQCVKELIQKVDDMQRTNEELIAENKRLNLIKRQLPVKLALKIHRKTTSTDEVKPIEITDLSEQKAMAGA